MSRPKHRRSSDISNRLVSEIVASKPDSAILAGRKQINVFLRHYFGNMPIEDLQGRSYERLGKAAIGHLEFGKIRKAGQPLLRIFNPEMKKHGYTADYTIVEMVNDDMPFLVDSVSAAIDRQNLVIHTTVHPIFRTVRDGRGRLKEISPHDAGSGQAESFIRFAIDRVSDK